MILKQGADVIKAFFENYLFICMFCMPVYSGQLLLQRIQPGTPGNPIKEDLPGIGFSTPQIWGRTSPIKDFTGKPSIMGNLLTRNGCDKCDKKIQYKAQGIQWPTLFMGSRIELVPSAEKKQFAVPANFPTLSDGMANPRNIIVNYDNSYTKIHEIVHVDHQFNLFKKIFSRLSDWSKNYQPGWYNDETRPEKALLEDYQKNIKLATEEFFQAKSAVNKFHDELLPARLGSGFLLGPESKGSAVSGVDANGRPLPWEQAYVLDDKTGEWTLVFKDGDESWRKDATDFINAYQVQFNPQTTGGDPEIPCVPAPVPILGIGVLFRYSQLLRRRSKQLHLMSNHIHLNGDRTNPSSGQAP